MIVKFIKGIYAKLFKEKPENPPKNKFNGKYARKGKVKVVIESFEKPKDKSHTFTGYRITDTEYTKFTIERPCGTNVKQAKKFVENGYKESKRGAKK